MTGFRRRRRVDVVSRAPGAAAPAGRRLESAASKQRSRRRQRSVALRNLADAVAGRLHFSRPGSTSRRRRRAGAATDR